MFKVDKDSLRIPPVDMDILHCHVAMLLFVSKWVRPKIQLSVAFLCTQIKAPTKQGYTKLRRVIGCLKCTVQLSLVVEIDSSGILTWYIDTSFVVHLGYKNHIGTCLTLAHGSMPCPGTSL